MNTNFHFSFSWGCLVFSYSFDDRRNMQHIQNHQSLFCLGAEQYFWLDLRDVNGDQAFEWGNQNSFDSSDFDSLVQYVCTASWSRTQTNSYDSPTATCAISNGEKIHRYHCDGQKLFLCEAPLGIFVYVCMYVCMDVCVRKCVLV